MKKKFIFLLTLIGLVFCLFGCKNYDFSITVPEELKVGDSYDLVATVDVVWSVSDETILKLEGAKITALKEGTVTVTASNSLKEDVVQSATITILKRDNLKYKITYDLDGGTNQSTAPTEYEENVGLTTLPTPTKEGYKFLGWYLNGNLVTSISSSQKGDITLVARYEYTNKMYSITYELDGGTNQSGAPTEYEENVGLTTLPTPTKEGYKFLGWYLNGDLVTSIPSTQKENIKLVAQFEYVNKIYSITYALDGGTNESTAPTEYEENVGLETLPTPTKEGYEFVGWYLSDISLYSYEKITADTKGNLNLKARWVSIVNQNPITLPTATYHFTNIKRVAHSTAVGVYVYQPDFTGLSAPSTSVLAYTWSSSDENIATISTYSSITAKNAGYCVITATYNTDPNITINCIIRVTSEGVEYASVEEANDFKVHTVTFVGMNNEVISTQTVVDGGFAYLPTPPVYEGMKFIGWSRDNYNIKSDVQIKAFYESGTNDYVGKKIAILGDSISTYQGYIPSGYSCFYPYPTADVNDVNQTWWMQMVNKIGAGLFVNNSYSGSCVATTNESSTQNDIRLSTLLIDGQTPDVIIIYMGSNDCASQNVSLADFTAAYKVMLDKLAVLCPNSEIILCTLPVSNLYTNDNRVQYNKVITDYASSYELKVIDFASLDITGDLVDSAHPYKSGMTKIANKAISELIGSTTTPEIIVSGEQRLLLNSSTYLDVLLRNLDGTVTYTSSDTTVATVDDTGNVTGVGIGTVDITVKCGDIESVFSMTITDEFIVTYNYNGGYSSELLVENKGSAPTLSINNYNYNAGTFWADNNYTSYIFIGTSSYDPKATFSDRIYIAKNSETGLYEVISILQSGASSWPSGAEYVISISNSYNGYNATVRPITQRITVGQIVVFSKDITSITATNPSDVYFFDEIPAGDSVTIGVSPTRDSLIVPGYLGFKFLGWYDESDKLYANATDLTKDVTLYAKWEELNPVKNIAMNAIPESLTTGETFQIIATVVPTDAYFKQIFYVSSNTDILTVSSAGLITAKNAGKASITIYDYMKKVEIVIEITVYSIDSIDINFDKEFNGTLAAGDTTQLYATAIGRIKNAEFTYQSSNTNILTVNDAGLLTGISNGTAEILVSIKNTTYNVTVCVNVNTYSRETSVDELLALIASNNFSVVETGNVSLYNDGYERVYVSTYGSVNRYLFSEFKVNETYYATSEANSNNHKNRRAADTIEFVTVHDTATLTGTVVSIASGMSSGETSIHYTVGNDAIYGVVPEKYIAYHAGDGTSAEFTWTKTDATATANVAPTFDVYQSGSNYYLTVNGVNTTITVPTINGAAPNKSYFTILGPTWKVEEGYYYIGGPLWYSSGYGQIGSRGGNCNSIGIEMCSNLSGDIYDTYQRTAQLVADILIRNNLDITRVKMHNTWSGKNCPQTMIAGSYWDNFMKMVELQYEVQKNYSGAEISIVSNNPSIVDNTGRVIQAPQITTPVSYNLTVKYGGETRTVTLHSIIPGTTTWQLWDGTYSTSTIWNNGVFAR